jgi:hypothetical protein
MARGITELEHQVVDLEGTLFERDQKINAARAANRDFIDQLDRF